MVCALTHGLHLEEGQKGFVLHGEDTWTASKVQRFVLLVCGLGKLDGRTSKAIRKLDKVSCHQLYQLLCSCGAYRLHREPVICQFTV